MNEHYCALHQTKFFRNEKNGKVWYSHKTDDPNFPNHFCNEAISAVTPPYTSKMEEKAEEIKEILGHGESYKIQKQHSQDMAIQFLEYCTEHGLDPVIEYDRVKSWTKRFLEDIDT